MPAAPRSACSRRTPSSHLQYLREGPATTHASVVQHDGGVAQPDANVGDGALRGGLAHCLSDCLRALSLTSFLAFGDYMPTASRWQPLTSGALTVIM